MCERNEVDDLMKKIEFVTLKNSNSLHNSSDSSIAQGEKERGRDWWVEMALCFGGRGVLGKKRENGIKNEQRREKK